VFHAKVQALIDDLYNNGYLDCTVAHVWTIEFQKWGLPHIHMIIFLHHEDKLHTPEDIDNLQSFQMKMKSLGSLSWSRNSWSTPLVVPKIPQLPACVMESVQKITLRPFKRRQL
jgi:hypothetical protein